MKQRNMRSSVDALLCSIDFAAEFLILICECVVRLNLSLCVYEHACGFSYVCMNYLTTLACRASSM